MKTKKIMAGYLIFAILAGIGLSVWRTVLLYRYFDPYNNEYMLHAREPLRALGYVMLACTVIALTAFIFVRKREFSMFTSSANQFSVFASSLLGFLFAASGILTLLYYPDKIFASEGTVFFRILLLAAFVSLFFSAIYFILSASTRYDGTKIKKAFSFFPTLFSVTYLSAAYLSPDFLFSNSNDILRNVSLAALVFFFIQETRSSVYDGIDPARFPIAVAALICVITYELPNLIVTAFWEVELTYMTMFELVECGIIIYLISCARSMIKSLKPQEKTKENTAV